MNIPGFSAQAALYRSSRRYRASTSFGLTGSQDGTAVTLAYYPSDPSDCNSCVDGCNNALAWCLAGAVFFPPAIAGCDSAYLGCAGACMFSKACCPKRCEFSLDFGDGCCDENEQCVDRYDPNSRHGCCPVGQLVCGGKCCPEGATCCGSDCCRVNLGMKCCGMECCPTDQQCCAGRCCPPDMKCCGTECCDRNAYCEFGRCGSYPSFGSYTPAPRPEPSKPVSTTGCQLGWIRCGDVCCPPDQKCCTPGVCDYICLH
jgi:hypothetical protein